MKKTNRTNELTKAVIKYLNAAGHFVWRQNNIGVWDAEKKIYRSGITKKGVADIIGVSRTGKALAIEIKTGKDKLSIEQIEFGEQWQKRGGYYIEIKELNEVTMRILQIIK